MWHIVIESVWFFCGSINRYQHIHLQNLRIKCKIFVSTSIMALIRSTGQLCLILCSRVSSTWRETEQWQPARRCDSGISWCPQELNSSTLLLLCAKAHIYLLLYL